ncbi:branched-chain amino acid ABC transporter permease [Bacillus sp. MRMR6]|uniref:branched-chain amino acid ABC transporter permease n=1 Tax=Bacillus sp. MRMR6 TaxID=1928617 RepID=UPI0009531C72|nr:branched-chain amino acid ABC transporter permease [Bacillus sp. MRMR6]OLS33767.1 hypothetical protein BTR25_24025 [Bacillus sp. MRMR6]
MTEFIQSVINGISIGAAYTLVGLGLTVIYSVYRLLNLAHGEFYMLGAYVSFFTMSILGFPFFVAVIASMIITGIFGLIAEFLVFRRLQHHSESDQVVATVGLFFFIENIALYFLTANFHSIVSPFPAQSVVKFAGLSISSHRLMIIIVTCIFVVMLHYFFSRTILGKQMRSVAQDRETAQLMGINIKFIGKVAFFLSCALAALAGTMMGSLQQVNPIMGFAPLLTALIVVILGGLGSNIGAIIGGLIIGITQSLAVTYTSAIVSNIAVYLILFLVLMMKPTGLFGGKLHA